MPASTPVDCGGGVLMPGLVDSHTHAIFGKPRADEQELRAAGLDYMEIAARGRRDPRLGARPARRGPRTTWSRSPLPRLQRLASHGTTTVEVKSGYGLTLDDELKTLRVIRRLRALIAHAARADLPRRPRNSRSRHAQLLMARSNYVACSCTR